MPFVARSIWPMRSDELQIAMTGPRAKQIRKKIAKRLKALPGLPQRQDAVRNG